MLYYNDLENLSIDGEIWVDAIGFEQVYEVSNLGRIKYKKYHTNRQGERLWIKKQYCNSSNNSLYIVAFREGKRIVLQLPALIWYSFHRDDLPKRRKGYVINKKNKVHDDCRLENLQIMTRGECNTQNSITGANKGRNLGGHSWTDWTKETSDFDGDGNVIRRTCRDCREKKGVDEFYPRMRQCKKCQNAQAMYRRRLRKERVTVKSSDKGKGERLYRQVVELEDLTTGKKVIYKGLYSRQIPITSAMISKYANTGMICYWIGRGKKHPPYRVKVWDFGK